MLEIELVLEGTLLVEVALELDDVLVEATDVLEALATEDVETTEAVDTTDSDVLSVGPCLFKCAFASSKALR